MSFAQNLKRLRGGRSQTAIAEAAGLTQSALSRYEKGKATPDLKTVLKLAAGLRVPLEPLVEGLDVRFDVVYRELQASITIPDEPAQPEQSLQLDVTPPDLDHDEEVDPTHPASRLVHLFAQALDIAKELRSWRPPAVARGGGPDLSTRARKRHTGSRPKPAQKQRATAKR